MGCTCANAGRRTVVPTDRPARLFVFSDDERIGRQLELLGHAVFAVRPALHPDGATDAMLSRFRGDAVVTDRSDGTFAGLPRVVVTVPAPCDACAAYAHQPAIAEALTRALSNTESSGPRERRNVIISGYYGAKNTGDNLLLEAIARALTAHDPSIEVSVAATNPGEVEKSHGLPAYSRKDLDIITPHLDTCTAFVLGGGGLWNDYNFNELGGVSALFGQPVASVPGWTQTQLLAQLLGARTHAYGLGVGPLSDDGARALVQLAAAGMQSVVVRDETSKALLAELGIATDVAPDPVYSLPLQMIDQRPIENRYVALNLRDWHYSAGDHLDQLRTALTGWCRANSASVIGIPMQPSDVKTLQAFISTMPDDIEASTLRWQHDPTAALAALAHADVVVAMRLHACLLAHRLGRAVVGLCYDPKVSEHFRELDRSDFALDLSSGTAELGAALDAAITGLPDATLRRIAEIEADATAGLRALAERIHATVPKRVPDTRTYPRAASPSQAPRKGLFGRMRG